MENKIYWTFSEEFRNKSKHAKHLNSAIELYLLMRGNDIQLELDFDKGSEQFMVYDRFNSTRTDEVIKETNFNYMLDAANERIALSVSEMDKETLKQAYKLYVYSFMTEQLEEKVEPIKDKPRTLRNLWKYRKEIWAVVEYVIKLISIIANVKK